MKTWGRGWLCQRTVSSGARAAVISVGRGMGARWTGLTRLTGLGKVCVFRCGAAKSGYVGGMEANLPSARVVKEFQFFPESQIVTIVFEDDSSEEFAGAENYHKARHACLISPQPASAELKLSAADGGSVAMTVVEGTPHETFEA